MCFFATIYIAERERVAHVTHVCIAYIRYATAHGFPILFLEEYIWRIDVVKMKFQELIGS